MWGLRCSESQAGLSEWGRDPVLLSVCHASSSPLSLGPHMFTACFLSRFPSVPTLVPPSLPPWCLSLCPWFNSGQPFGNKKGYYWEENILLNLSLFPYCCCHSANIPGLVLISQPPLTSHNSQPALFFDLMLFWLVISNPLLDTRK